MPIEALLMLWVKQGQHDQAGHDEGAVMDAADMLDARSDRAAEHDEIERGGDHRGGDALHTVRKVRAISVL